MHQTINIIIDYSKEEDALFSAEMLEIAKLSGYKIKLISNNTQFNSVLFVSEDYLCCVGKRKEIGTPFLL